jgi:hypothetical protein
MSESSDQPDYVWHFKLSSKEGERLHPDALTEMLRQQLKALLGCVALTSNGTSLRVTGFRLLDDPGVEHAVYPALTKPSTTEPEIPSEGAIPEGQVR